MKACKGCDAQHTNRFDFCDECNADLLAHFNAQPAVTEEEVAHMAALWEPQGCDE